MACYLFNDLIKEMILIDRCRRITAYEVLRMAPVDVAPDKSLDPAVLTRLTQFSAMNKLKKMVLKEKLLLLTLWDPFDEDEGNNFDQMGVFGITDSL
ncbi:hypothetical protein Tco_0200221 [Tanacetum coccineum]